MKMFIMIVLLLVTVVAVSARLSFDASTCFIANGQQNRFYNFCTCGTPDNPDLATCQRGETCCAGSCCGPTQFCDLGVRNEGSSVGACREGTDRQTYVRRLTSGNSLVDRYSVYVSRNIVAKRNTAQAQTAESQLSQALAASRPVKHVKERGIKLTDWQAEDSCLPYFLERCLYFAGDVSVEGRACVCNGFHPNTGRPVIFRSFARG